MMVVVAVELLVSVFDFSSFLASQIHDRDAGNDDRQDTGNRCNSLLES